MRQISRNLTHFICGLAASALSGCADVAFTPGSTLDNKVLVFGRISLDRDGEKLVLSPFSTQILIRNVETSDEPRVLAQRFDTDGGFRWAMPPGQYQLSIVLHPYSGGLQTYSFRADDAGSSYYFGDLVLHGKRRFDNVGSANIRDIKPEFNTQLEPAKAQLLATNPQLNPSKVSALSPRDMAIPSERWRTYREALEKYPSCCQTLAQLPFQKIELGKTISLRVGPDTKVFDFAEGRSRFLAFELPESGTPYEIKIKSFVTPSGMMGTGWFYIFSPAALVLDGKFNTVASQERGLFFPVPSSAIPPRSASLQAQIPSARLPPGSKYLVLYTTRSIIEGTWKTTGPGFIPIVGGVIPSGFAVLATMEPAISGEVEIELTHASH